MMAASNEELLRLVAEKGHWTVRARAAAALNLSAAEQAIVLRDLVPEALLNEGDLGKDVLRQLVEQLSPGSDSDEDDQFLDFLPPTPCSPEELERLYCDAEAAGYENPTHYIRWKLFG